MKLRAASAAMIAVLIVSAALAACGGGAGSSTRTAVTGSSAASTVRPDKTIYPLTITDQLGRSVTFDAAPATVAALSPTTVEFVFGASARSRTRSTDTLEPDLAQFAVDVGPVARPDFSLVMAQKPDLIVADAVLQAGLRGELEALGPKVVFVGARTYAEVSESQLLLGRILDKQHDAGITVSQVESALQSVRDSLPAARVRALIVLSASVGLLGAKPSSFVGDILLAAGGVNVLDEQPDAPGMPGYTELTSAGIAAARPDVVVILGGAADIAATITGDPALAGVPAVKNGRVTQLDPELFVHAPGPRVWGALQALSVALYPSVFGQPQ